MRPGKQRGVTNQPVCWAYATPMRTRTCHLEPTRVAEQAVPCAVWPNDEALTERAASTLACTIIIGHPLQCTASSCAACRDLHVWQLRTQMRTGLHASCTAGARAGARGAA